MGSSLRHVRSVFRGIRLQYFTNVLCKNGPEPQIQRPKIIRKEVWPLNECVFYLQIQAAKAGLF